MNDPEVTMLDALPPSNLTACRKAMRPQEKQLNSFVGCRLR